MKYIKEEKITNYLGGIIIILIIILITIFFKGTVLENEFYTNNMQMQYEIDQIRNVLQNDIIDESHKLEIKKILEDDDNQLTYIRIKEKNTYGRTVFQYPEDIIGEHFNNSIGNNIPGEKVDYYLEIGINKLANINNSEIYYVFSFSLLVVCWLIGGLISIIRIHRVKNINGNWIIISVLTSILSYYIYKILRLSNKKIY